MKYTEALALSQTTDLRKIEHSRRTSHMRRRKQEEISCAGHTIPPGACRSLSRTARITTDPINILRNSYRFPSYALSRRKRFPFTETASMCAIGYTYLITAK